MTLRIPILGLLLITAFASRSLGQKANTVTVSKYLTLVSATYRWQQQGMVRKKPAPQGPRKICTVEFLVKRDCNLSHPGAYLGGSELSGKVLYDNSSSDSFRVKKGGRVVFEFIQPQQAPRENTGSKKNSLIKLTFCINSTKVSLSATLKEKKAGINEPLYQ